MKKIAIVIHGGAGDLTPYLKKHIPAIEEGLAQAAQMGYRILTKGGSALDAVEEAVKILEDHPFFNAGRGSALNYNGEVEMDASIMDGKNLKAGAVSMVKMVKNPISLARIVMRKTKHVCLAGYGALALAKHEGIQLALDEYFMTEHQYLEFRKKNRKRDFESILQQKSHGTVGAVAVDKRGNIAAGTSTGGTSNCLPGRIGDSCVIGAGCYANNQTCAMSGTGEGEYFIRGVIGHTIAMLVEQGMPLQAACDHVLHVRHAKTKGDMGVIAVNAQGDIGISFNTRSLKRAWICSGESLQVKIFI